jgi:acetyl esterase/lipase
MNLKIQSQDKIYPLWKDAIPGEIVAPNYEEKEVYKDNVLQSTSNVKIPTLAVYTPHEVAANGTAVIILPGGGYSHLSMNKEGKKIAEWLNSLGITAFVLKYRLPNDQIMKDKTIGPLQDAQEAIRVIRRNAIEWNVDPNKIGVIGFSAGGHLATTLSTHFDEKVYIPIDSLSARPNFSLLIYPVISMNKEITHKGSRENLLGNNPILLQIDKFSNELQVNEKTPPTFLVHATDDQSVPVENSINYYLALKRSKVSAELHIYEKGGHGFGLGVKDTSQFWTSDCIHWLKNHNYITHNK